MATFHSVSPMGLNPDTIKPNYFGVYDEVGSFPWVEQINVKWPQISELFMELSMGEQPGASELSQVLIKIKKLQTKATKARFGLNSTDLIGLFDGIDLSLVEEILGDFRSKIENANYHIVKASIESEVNPDDVFLQSLWLEYIVNYVRDGIGSMSLDWSGVHITIANDRLRRSIERFGLNYFLDATLTRPLTEFYTGLQSDKVLVIRVESEVPETLEIIGVSCDTLGWSRSQHFTDVVAPSFRKYVKKTHGNVGFVDKKADAKPEDVVWFSDSRGSNRLQKCKAIGLIGVPMINLGAAIATYEAISGRKTTGLDDADFNFYYQSGVQAELLQGLGRLRYNRRQNENLTAYILTSYDLTFLQAAGFKVTRKSMVSIDPRCATTQQKALIANIHAIGTLLQKGLEVTTKAVGHIAERDKSNVWRLSQKFGGWDKFVELIRSMLGYSKSTVLKDIPQELQDLADQFSEMILKPEVTTDELVDQLTLVELIYPNKITQNTFMACLNPEAIASFVLRILSLLPGDLYGSVKDRLILLQS